MDMFGVAVLIFLVTDPFGNMFLAALKGVAPAPLARGVSRAGLRPGPAAALPHPRRAHPQRPRPVPQATGIAGGIILFVIAMRLIFPSPQGLLGEVPDGEPLLVPLATPAVAGPRRWRC